jgi:hypothetical protein
MLWQILPSAIDTLIRPLLPAVTNFNICHRYAHQTHSSCCDKFLHAH